MGLEWERALSAIFIASERYGTRSSSILMVGEDLQATFVERSFDSERVQEVRASFDWSGKGAGERGERGLNPDKKHET